MARYVVSSEIYAPLANGFNLVNDFDILLVTQSGVLWGGDTGGRYGINALGDDQLIQMNGSALGERGISINGTLCQVIVGATGVVVGDSAGVWLGAGNNVLVNRGEITGTDWGVDATGSINFQNFGHVSGVVAVGGGSLDDVLRNAGAMTGVVSLRDGNDLFDGTGGTVSGYIDLGTGNDTAIGGASGEVFFDGQGSDDISGGAGNDTFRVEADGDVDIFDGGSGSDTLSFIFSPFGIRLDLTRGIFTSQAFGADEITGFERVLCNDGHDRVVGDAAANVLQGRGGRDSLYGLGGDDVIFGGLDAAINLLDGGDGNDRIYGAEGADRIYGGAGNDVIYGRYDVDVMTGGTGEDRFLFRDVGELFIVAGIGRDRITDFTAGADVIDLSAIDWNGTGIDDAFTFVGTGAITGPGQVGFRVVGGMTYVDLSWQTSGVAGTIALNGVIALTAGDFLL